jgi:hypothetical protein
MKSRSIDLMGILLLVNLIVACIAPGPTFYLSTGFDSIARGKNGACPTQTYSDRFTSDDTICVFLSAETNQEVRLSIRIRRDAEFNRDSRHDIVAERTITVTDGSHLVKFEVQEIPELRSGTYYLVELVYKDEVWEQLWFEILDE